MGVLEEEVVKVNSDNFIKKKPPLEAVLRVLLIFREKLMKIKSSLKLKVYI